MTALTLRQNTHIYDMSILYRRVNKMQYSPEHIETSVNEYAAKGGYSASKLLENQRHGTMVGGAANNTHDALLDKLKHLQVPLGLVSRRYPSKARHNNTDAAFLDSKIFEELESMIFHNKKTGTRKNIEIIKSTGTKKYRPTKHSKNT
jgi:hypothetical protein